MAGVSQAQQPTPKTQLFEILALFQVPAYLDLHILCIHSMYLSSLMGPFRPVEGKLVQNHLLGHLAVGIDCNCFFGCSFDLVRISPRTGCLIQSPASSALTGAFYRKITSYLLFNPAAPSKEVHSPPAQPPKETGTLVLIPA